MKVIGLTGGIGSGKSFVAALACKRFGIPVIQADEAGHKALEWNAPPYEMVIKEFGTDILNEDGTINRGKLGTVVFSDAQKLERLNVLTHPYIKEILKKQIETYKKKAATPYLILETPLLLKSGFDSFCDEVWYVTAKEEVRIKRLMENRGYSLEKARKMMAAQEPAEQIMPLAHHIIVNNGSLEEITNQLEFLLV